MTKVEGKIIIAFKADATPEHILLVEQYLNGVVDKIMYANMGVSIRVHLGEDHVK